MREILFRGKRVDNDEWVYGLPYERFGEIQAIRFQTSDGDNIGHSVYAVDTDTVGQYTGLTDKRGTKIFEGDILRFGKRNLMVWWNGESFQWEAKEVYGYDVITKENCLDNDWTNIDLGWIASEVACVGKMTTEIIGNIFDNSELIVSRR